MMKYKLIEENDPKTKKQNANHVITDKTQELVYDMIITMQEYDGIGLQGPTSWSNGKSVCNRT